MQYFILGVLGQGRTGVVYAASHGDRSIALKAPREDQVPTGKERRRFLTEAEHMGRLRHPGIVKVYGAGEPSRTAAPTWRWSGSTART